MKYLSKCCWLMGVVFWPWIPRYTDALWAVDGPTAATWHMTVGIPLSIIAIVAGVYLPIRRRKIDKVVSMLWIFSFLVIVFQKTLVISANEMHAILLDHMQGAIDRGYVLDRIDGGNVVGERRPIVYRINRGVRWPIFYQKISEQQARIYYPWAWGRKVGGIIDVERGLLSLE